MRAEQLVREPMYQQLNGLLRELLRNGDFREGDQFLTERQIVEKFQLSRPLFVQPPGNKL